jgi:hypothetical protein
VEQLLPLVSGGLGGGGGGAAVGMEAGQACMHGCLLGCLAGEPQAEHKRPDTSRHAAPSMTTRQVLYGSHPSPMI